MLYMLPIVKVWVALSSWQFMLYHRTFHPQERWIPSVYQWGNLQAISPSGPQCPTVPMWSKLRSPCYNMYYVLCTIMITTCLYGCLYVCIHVEYVCGWVVDMCACLTRVMWGFYKRTSTGSIRDDHVILAYTSMAILPTTVGKKLPQASLQMLSNIIQNLE